jgi:hypothetical protein
MSMPKSFLRLVHDRDSDGQAIVERAHFEQVQESFFETGARTLVVCTSDSLDEPTFLDLLSTAHVGFVLDLRTSPRFDFGSLNRKRVFLLFEALNVRYIDVGGITSPAAIEAAIPLGYRSADFNTPSEFGALALVDSREDYRDLGLALARSMRHVTSAPWEVVLRGPPEPTSSKRNLIFISHATPEDNDFALWLQAQLGRNGYQTWADVTHLAAGEVFWETIEQTIRHQAVRVVVVNSRVASSKPGVQDEVALAVSVERAQSIGGFVVPIRLDDLPYNEFRANIARKVAIDFRESWASGLNQLLATFKRDHVPRQLGSGADQLSAWWEARKTPRSWIVPKPESLISNEYVVAQLPTQLYVLTGDPTATRVLASGKPLASPLVPFAGSWISFMSADELRKSGLGGLAPAKAATVEDVLKGYVSFVSHLNEPARKRLITRLLNRQWEFFLEERGMVGMRLTKGAPTLYVPKGLIEKDQVEFVDVDGVKRKRILVGRSEKRKVNWHLGLVSRFSVAEDCVLRLRLRVVFTEGESFELVAQERMRDLRRRFCKNWWNDRWRTLQLAMGSWLAEGKPTISLLSGSGGTLSVQALPRVFYAPVGIDEQASEIADSLGDELENYVGADWDWLDDDLVDEESNDMGTVG